MDSAALIDAKPGEQVAFFHDVQKRFITGLTDAARREQAGVLAAYFGADPQRLIDYLGWKWGVFKRRGRKEQ